MKLLYQRLFLESTIYVCNGKNNSSVNGDVSGTITVFTEIEKSSNPYGKNDNNSSNNSIISNYDHEVIVSIKDRGTGNDPDIQDKLFSKFATKLDTGSGLGLYFKRYCRSSWWQDMG